MTDALRPSVRRTFLFPGRPRRPPGSREGGKEARATAAAKVCTCHFCSSLNTTTAAAAATAPIPQSPSPPSPRRSPFARLPARPRPLARRTLPLPPTGRTLARPPPMPIFCRPRGRGRSVRGPPELGRARPREGADRASDGKRTGAARAILPEEKRRDGRKTEEVDKKVGQGCRRRTLIISRGAGQIAA